MILPVFVSAWELDCCQPEATIGEEWAGCLLLDPPLPWWTSEAYQTSAEAALGVTSLEVDVLRVASDDEAMALVAAGPARLGVKGLREPGRHLLRGRVTSEWHGPDPNGIELAEVACRGVVRRVRLVPIVFEHRGDRAWYPVGQLPAVDVRSTADRRRDPMPIGNEPYQRDDLLVDLEVLGPDPEAFTGT